MKKRSILFIIFVFAFSNSLYAEDLICPPLPPLPEGADDLRMTEADFTRTRFESSLLYFQTSLPTKLKSAETTRELTGRAVFWVSYRNGLKFIEGYMLKQSALLELSSEKRGSGKSAVDEFCSFVKEAKYLD
jgi:hypothetical protein